mgnify:CR=1 FL=1
MIWVYFEYFHHLVLRKQKEKRVDKYGDTGVPKSYLESRKIPVKFYPELYYVPSMKELERFSIVMVEASERPDLMFQSKL